MADKAQQILDLVDQLSVVELSELVKAFEEKYGVSAAPVMMAGWAAAGWDEGWASDSVKVELTEIGQQKINVIKAAKEVLGLSLTDAKTLVEKAPVILKEWVKMDEAETIKAKFTEAGATISFK